MLSTQFEEIIQKRRSNRRYDPTIKVDDAVIERSLQRSILSPNSSNMQLWEFYWIKSEEEKKAFLPLCLGQSAAKDTAHMVVFVTRQDLWKKRAAWNLHLWYFYFHSLEYLFLDGIEKTDDAFWRKSRSTCNGS
jgi:nitroreductase